MAVEFIDSGEEKNHRAWAVMAAMAVGLLGLILLGIFAVFRFVDGERTRDLQAWQVRLGIVADSRAGAVDLWFDDLLGSLRSLSENASLQLYLSDVLQSDSADPAASPQAGYLQNLLIATADRSGFEGDVTGPDIPANVERVGIAGLALTDPAGRALVTTRGMPPLQAALQQQLATRRPAESVFFDLHKGVTGLPTIGFAVPVFAVQGDHTASTEIGLIIGIRPLDKSFYQLLEQPGETGVTAETLLVRRRDSVVEYLSPLADETGPLRKVLAADTPDLSSVFAISSPGGFAAKRDYAGNDVLVTGRVLSSVPWTLVRKIDSAEAMAEIDRRQRNLTATFLGALLFVSLLVVAVWRHGTSVRASEAAANFRDLAGRFERLNQFLRIVTDGQPTAIAAVDRDGQYKFANRQAADGLGISTDDMIGKRMASVIGPVKARIFEKLNQQALATGEPVTETHGFDDDSGEHIVKTDHIPLGGIVEEDSEDVRPGVLMVMQDITDLMREKNRREGTLRQLIATLVGLVDRRDPYSAHHSSRVAEVAAAIGEEMELDPATLDTIEIAANLMNLGKIFIPKSLLTKTDALTGEEFQLIRDSLAASAELISGIEFDGPVEDTLRQISERWDGAGPKGLAGEDIALGARVIAVANAFVGMVSPRAYRSAMPFDKACDELRDQDGAFDRRPVSALVNLVDNRGGRERWAEFQRDPESSRLVDG